MKKMNNKGFSLVELIIVIAIMAVLIAVLAPQYLKYVEKSRVSADGQTADEFVSAFQVLASDPDMADAMTATEYKVSTAANSGQITMDSATETLLKNVMPDIDTKKPSFKSKTFKTPAFDIKITFTGGAWHLDNGAPSVSGS